MNQPYTHIYPLHLEQIINFKLLFICENVYSIVYQEVTLTGQWATLLSTKKVEITVMVVTIANVPLVLTLCGGASDKKPACQCRRYKRHGFDPWVVKVPCRRA